MPELVGGSAVIAPVSAPECSGAEFAVETEATLYRASVATNRYGEYEYSAGETISVSVSELSFGEEQTGARAGGAYSSSKAYETTVDGRSKILVGPSYGIKVTDKITLYDESFYVSRTSPKEGVSGASGCSAEGHFELVLKAKIAL